MFNKLSPVVITDEKDRKLFIVAMLWFFIGAWIDSSAHTYLIDDIELFLHPGTVFYIRVMLFQF